MTAAIAGAVVPYVNGSDSIREAANYPGVTADSNRPSNQPASRSPGPAFNDTVQSQVASMSAALLVSNALGRLVHAPSHAMIPN